MSKLVTINREEFIVNEDEYNFITTTSEFCNLKILDSLAIHERLIALLYELSICYKAFSPIKPNLIHSTITHGGFIPIKISPFFNIIQGIVESNETFNNMEINRQKYSVDNISIFQSEVWDIIANQNNDTPYFAFISGKQNDNISFVDKKNPIFLLSDHYIPLESNYTQYSLTFTNFSLFVHNNIKHYFEKHFAPFIKENFILDFDNLIHLTMIVKNAGDSFVDVLKNNIDYFDEYTILDTGSTDNTIENIKSVLKSKKGNLFQEPFINFRDSRNRCLDLAGKSCKFIMMLDDTYMIKENLRGFLQIVRGDQFSDSLSMYIKSDDVEYGSNRIIKSHTNLRYIYKMHEVISPINNVNVIIPINHGYIFDFRSDYMETRTMERKNYDLKILYDMIEEDPNDSRAYYYLGQTYNLLQNYEKAYANFLIRVYHENEGFLQEKIDACFEAARVANFQLNKPWQECEELYLKAYEMDKTRPDSLYFLGIHYYLEKKYDIAYNYFKEAYKVSYPIHCQYSLKPTLSFFFLPKFLAEVSYIMNDFILGEEVTRFFLEKNAEEKNDKKDYYTMKCWKKIFHELNTKVAIDNKVITIEEKPTLVFIVNGGFMAWSGSDIEKKGMGGSETFIVEISKYITQFNVVIFCNTTKKEEYKGVTYYPLHQYKEFISNNYIHTAIVSRYPEYLAALYQCSNIENVYLILHDLIFEGEIVLRNPKLKKILCLSDYHTHVFNEMFPILSDLTEKFEYGIDIDLFSYTENTKKVPNKFIYSSFANRGLLYLLQMWPKIIQKLPDATLFVHCDLENTWLNSVVPEEMKMIKSLIFDLKNSGVFYKGWTSKKELASTWHTASVWFYPTTFLETFCLTALEAAISKTLAVSFPIGSLVETIGDRGVLINKNITTTDGQNESLDELFSILENQNRKNELIQKNYEWALQKSWKQRADALEKLLVKFD